MNNAEKMDNSDDEYRTCQTVSNKTNNKLKKCLSALFINISIPLIKLKD
jgi:hypothetical protein